MARNNFKKYLRLDQRLFLEHAFALQERALSPDTPTISGQRAVASQDAVTGNGDRHQVGGTRAGDRARGAGSTDGAGNLGIGRGLAERNLAKLLPNALLKFGSIEVEFQVEVPARMLDIVDDGGEGMGEFGRVVGAQVATTRLRKTPPQWLLNLTRILADKDRADAFGGSSDQNETERGFTQGIINRGCAAGGRLCCGHRGLHIFAGQPRQSHSAISGSVRTLSTRALAQQRGRAAYSIRLTISLRNDDVHTI